jgi:hypothetical protein
MTKQVAVLSAIVAVVTSVLTTGVWMMVGPASAAGGRVSVVSKLIYTEKAGSTETVQPGEEVTSVVDCPDKNSIAIDGGYAITGHDFLGVASATSNYGAKLGTAQGWDVHVTNPAGAGGPVTFQAKVRCLQAVQG